MRVDFYQLGSESAERAIPLLAAKARDAGHRLLVVARDEGFRKTISDALWAERAEDFLAHGEAGTAHEVRQPLLLSPECVAPNGARLLMLADGEWREGADSFERTLLLFGDDRVQGARATWRMLGEREEIERRFWKREGGRWVEGP